MDQATELRALVRQAASSRAPAVTRSRRIVVFGGKGGVGATTIAVNLSAALAQLGQRCLLCDAAGGDVSLQLRLEPRYTLADVLAAKHGVEEAVLPGPAGVQILPGAREMACSRDAAEHAWKELLGQLPQLACRFDTMVIDAGNRADALDAANLAVGRSPVVDRHARADRDNERLCLDQTTERSQPICVDCAAYESHARRDGDRRGPAAVGRCLPPFPRPAAAECGDRAGRYERVAIRLAWRDVCAGSASVCGKLGPAASGPGTSESGGAAEGGGSVILECDGLPSLFRTRKS